MSSYSDSYRKAGVDVTAGYKAVELMKKHVESTYTPGVLGSIGGFGGMFMPNLANMTAPVLVSGTDGVGTKLKIAFLLDKHDTIGIDCVAMCVNDIICCGAAPLFFLDYLAVGKNTPEMVEQIVAGVAEGCRQAGCALIGGETAEMPGFYPKDEYDLAGFCTGIVDKPKILDNTKVKAGDMLIGIKSSGLHSNGFSLARNLLNVNEERLSVHVDDLGHTLGEELLTPTRIYVKQILELLDKGLEINGISNITGGGFFENIPRMLPDGVTAKIDLASCPQMPIFNILQSVGNIETREMYNTFNMGVGMVLAVDKKDCDKALAVLKEGFVMGECVAGDELTIG